MIRTREQWLKKYHTNSSKTIAQYALKAYDQYLQTESLNENTLFQETFSEEDEKYFFLDAMVQSWHENKKSPGTIKTYFPFIRSYMRFMGARTIQEDIKDYVSFPKTPKEIRKPMTKEKIGMILDKSNKLYAALFLTLLSSGMRVSEALSLTKNDVEFNDTITKITIPAQHTKTQQERETFISKQATDAIVKFGIDGSQIFPTNLVNCELYMSELRLKLGLLDKYSNGRNYHVNIHSFRSYFNTQATLLHGAEYAHAILGHGGYLPQYFRLTDEIKIQKYKELEPFVTID